MLEEFPPNFYVGINDESGQVVDVMTWLVEIFDRDRVRISKADEILKNEGVVLPQTTPKYSSKSVQCSDSDFGFF